MNYKLNIFQVYLNKIFYYGFYTEYAGNLGDDGDKEWQEQEQRHILKMVDKL